MGASLVYRSARFYELAMRALYGRHYAGRYQAIGDLIPQGASVLELCCGPGFLYERQLRMKRVDYTGVDLNDRFVARVISLGGKGLVRDITHAEPLPLPPADYVVIQAGLYQFLPDVRPIIDRMRESARDSIIIAEPIRNLANSRIPLVAALARRQSDVRAGTWPSRFTEAMLDRLLAGPDVPMRRCFLIAGGREKVYLLDAHPKQWHLSEEVPAWHS